MQRVLLALFLVFLPILARGGTVTQDSIFWPTSDIGDGLATGYTSDQWQWAMRMMWLNDPTTQGVSQGYLNELELTNPAGTVVRVATGGAIVYGFPFRSTTDVDLTLFTPVIGTTGYRVVLRADWATQTVRIVLLQSADGVAAAPAATQTAGVTWEISLGGGTITVAPVVAIQDVRTWLDPGIEIDNTKLADRDRSLFVQPVECVVSAAHVVRTSRYGWSLADAVDTECFGAFRVPEDYGGTNVMVIRPVFVPNGAGGGLIVSLTNNAEFSATGEAPNTHAVTSGVVLTPIGAVEVITIAPITLNPTVLLDDWITLRLFRDGNGAGDTYTDTLFFMGWWVDYTADM